jgi:hypothetical protein
MGDGETSVGSTGLENLHGQLPERYGLDRQKVSAHKVVIIEFDCAKW